MTPIHGEINFANQCASCYLLMVIICILVMCAGGMEGGKWRIGGFTQHLRTGKLIVILYGFKVDMGDRPISSHKLIQR